MHTSFYYSYKLDRRQLKLAHILVSIDEDQSNDMTELSLSQYHEKSQVLGNSGHILSFGEYIMEEEAKENSEVNNASLKAS